MITYPAHDYLPRVSHWLHFLAEAGLPHLRAEAAQLLADGWKEEDWAIAGRGAELSLLGVGKDLTKSEWRPKTLPYQLDLDL